MQAINFTLKVAEQKKFLSFDDWKAPAQCFNAKNGENIMHFRH